MTAHIPETPADYDQMRLIERPDGFYWQDKLSDDLYGPFQTLLKAVQNMVNHEDSGYEEGESLKEAEAEIGIADWIDPQTGDPAENLPPHLRDE